MTKLWTLMRVQMRQRYSIAMLRQQWRGKRGKMIGMVALWGFVALVMLSVYVLYAFGAVWLVSTIRAFRADLARDLLALLFLLASVFFLFSGTRTVLSTVFMAKDTTFLAMLPVKQSVVFFSKFFLLLAGQCAMSAALVLPPALAYQAGVYTAGFFVRLLAVIFCLPCIPLVFSALFSLLLMRFAALSRFRDFFVVAGSLLLTLLVIAAQQLVLSQIPEDIDAFFILQYFLGRSTMIQSITAWYPPARFAVQALSTSAGAWLQMLWLLLTSVLALGIVYVLASRVYYRGVLSMQNTRRRARRSRGTLRYAQRPVWRAIVWKEWTMMLRTPVYALNSLASVIFIPLFAFLPLVQPSLKTELDGLLTVGLGQLDDRILLIALSAILCFFTSINPAASTVFSREGKDIWLCKVLPGAPRQQMLGKFIFGAQLLVLFEGIFVLVLLVYLRAKWQVLLCAFVISLALGWISLVVAVYADARAPRLAWVNPTQAIKQSWHAMLSFIVALLLAGIVAGAGYLLYSAEMPFLVVFAILAGLAAALAAGMTIKLLSDSDRLYDGLGATL